MMTPSLTWAIALLLVAVSGAARAQPATNPAPPSVAREQERTSLYREGVALAEEGRWSEALVKFELVVAIRAAPPALVALARAQEELGRLALAKRTYRRVIEDARTTPTAPALVEKATTALSSLEARVPRVIVRIPTNIVPAQLAQLTIDGQPIAVDPRGAELDPGRHQVTVSAPGKKSFEATFVVDQREVKEIVAVLLPVAATDEPPRAPPTFNGASDGGTAEDSSVRPIARWVLAGAGAAALITGGIVYAQGRSDYDRAVGLCPTRMECSSDVGTTGNAARQRMLTGELVGGAGLMAVAGAVGWWALQRSPRAPTGAASSDAAHRTFISGVLAPGAALLTASASF
jgi:hypothetical protein